MNFLKKTARLLFPQRCPLCREIIPATEDTCKSCSTKQHTIPNDVCIRCSTELSRCGCSKDDIDKIPFITAVYFYTDDVRQAIIDFKFNRKRSNAEFFASRLSEKVACDFCSVDFDFVCFAPMTKAAVKSRGYNQSELLAREISKRLILPCCNALVKTRETLPQHKLNLALRQTNLKNAIAVTSSIDVKGKTILLCDDIKTTGATLKECVAALKSAGAKEVYCACIAIAYNGNNLFT